MLSLDPSSTRRFSASASHGGARLVLGCTATMAGRPTGGPGMSPESPSVALSSLCPRRQDFFHSLSPLHAAHFPETLYLHSVPFSPGSYSAHVYISHNSLVSSPSQPSRAPLPVLV